jgi:hypothetical protein
VSSQALNVQNALVSAISPIAIIGTICVCALAFHLELRYAVGPPACERSVQVVEFTWKICHSCSQSDASLVFINDAPVVWFRLNSHVPDRACPPAKNIEYHWFGSKLGTAILKTCVEMVRTVEFQLVKSEKERRKKREVKKGKHKAM